jgi:diguanylate cyclase (GGDEF)-like protein
MSLSLETAFDEYPAPFFIVKPLLVGGQCEDFEYIYVNPAFCLFLGHSHDEMVGHRFSELFGVGERFWLDLFADSALSRRHAMAENVSTLIDRKLAVEAFHIEPDLCGCIIRNFVQVSSSEKKSEEMSFRANHDFLTGFYNRYYLRELCTQLSSEESVGVSFIDINYLKKTNDTFGHAAGDQLILKVAQHLRELYSGSLIFRVGGDEFVAITADCTREEYERRAAKARCLFEQSGLAAIGSRYFEQVDDLEACVNCCDLLMYQHKKEMRRSAEEGKVNRLPPIALSSNA